MAGRIKREASLNAKNLSNALSRVYSRWDEVGNQLEIPLPIINNIQRNKHGNVNMCTLGLIDHWLRTDVRATWEKLAEALENMQENDVAADIREKYIPGSLSGPHTGSSSGSSSGTTSGSSSGARPLPSSQGQPRVVVDSHGPVSSSLNGGNDIRHIHVLIGNTEQEDKLEQMIRLYSEDSSMKLDEVDHQGCTLVHHSAKKRDLEAMKALVALGADINAMDVHHFTPYDAANYVGCDEVADFLKKLGGMEGRVMLAMESPQAKRPRMASVEEQEERLRDDRLVLCLDSSSTMAVVQLEYLHQMEKVTDRPITDLFAWVVASGVGGFLMLAMLYCNYGVDELRRLYFRLRSRVFCGLDQKRRGAALREFAVEVFGHVKMNSSDDKIKLMIGAVDKQSTALQPKFFTSFDSEDAARSVWEVACYTCSTPLYIGENDQHVDGGSIYKNPSVFALGYIMERCRTYGAEVNGVVSLGDGQRPSFALRQLDDSNYDIFVQSTKDALTREISEACSRICYTLGQSYYRFDPLLTVDDYVHKPEEATLQTLVNILLRTVSQCHNDDKLKDFGRKFS